MRELVRRLDWRTQVRRFLLTSDNPATFSAEVDARIQAEFERLVAGDLCLQGPSGGS